MTQATLTVPAAQANRDFSKLLRAARDGAKITITSHGQPVAELGPVGVESISEAVEMDRRRKAREDLLAHLRSVKPTVVGPWTRDELYERD
ncbi:MAG TPA: type II toxin-antitoxin system prevent-host-death family antitoxin [Caulobacteraceae bacterium]|nr:type II toxin-antitoxin system prevent-host-death family antitoxin [Caulobacteraceae bacterium]